MSEDCLWIEGNTPTEDGLYWVTWKWPDSAYKWVNTNPQVSEATWKDGAWKTFHNQKIILAYTKVIKPEPFIK